MSEAEKSLEANHSVIQVTKNTDGSITIRTDETTMLRMWAHAELVADDDTLSEHTKAFIDLIAEEDERDWMSRHDPIW